MKMNKLIRLIVLAFALSMPISIWGQCASIYQKGETYMKRGRYRDAIKSFKAAMKCDSNLEQACKNKIKECEEKINPASSSAFLPVCVMICMPPICAVQLASTMHQPCVL